MIEMTLDNQLIQVEEGQTILAVAEQHGIEIPNLCFLKGYAPYVSCMVCLVEDLGQKTLKPACATFVTDGMQISTNNERVKAIRRQNLELMISEHIGDCLAPCQAVCPLDLDIPKMLKALGNNDITTAQQILSNQMPLPAILSELCPAPCQKICRLSAADGAIKICEIKRFLTKKISIEKSSQLVGKKIAIIGASALGLALAYFLQKAGALTYLYEADDEIGNSIKTKYPQLSLKSFTQDIEPLKQLGCNFMLKHKVEANLSQIESQYDLMINTVSKFKIDSNQASGLGKKYLDGALKKPKKIAQQVNLGKKLANQISLEMSQQLISEVDQELDCKIGKIEKVELDEFIALAQHRNSKQPLTSPELDSLVSESRRCLQCDCSKLTDCKLRHYASKYKADKNAFGKLDRYKKIKYKYSQKIVFEEGKCIKCGICTRISEKAGEKWGLTFKDRGFEAQLCVPFDQDLNLALELSADECVKACPTGALSKLCD